VRGSKTLVYVYLTQYYEEKLNKNKIRNGLTHGKP
jgi:hypothetical protein